jgi:hypothetical protein
MRRTLVAIVVGALLVVLPGAAEASTKRFTVTLKAKPVSYVIVKTCEGKPTGYTLTLTGTVSPVRAGKRVRIYKKLDGKGWGIEGEARVRSSGRFTFTDRPTTLTHRRYKARMATVGSYRFAYSDTIRVTTHQAPCPD